MKKKSDIVANVPEFPLIDEKLLKTRIYTIRGVKVMLDSDLAEIYGYSTKAFNQQVKNNIEKFAEDFRFQLNKDELAEVSRSKNLTLEQAKSLKMSEFGQIDVLRSKNLTANLSSKSRSFPYAFTEQGIYMLMTVLKGEQATAQSIALIRLFKQMKDYLVIENQQLLGNSGIAEFAVQTIQNTRDIATISAGVRELSGEVHNIDERLEKVGLDIQKVMENFIDPTTLLRGIAPNVQVAIYSEPWGNEGITPAIKADFEKARPDVSLKIDRPNRKFHDRYVFLDYGTRSEKLFHCGASSKDGGKKITTIMQIECPEMYHPIVDKLKKPSATGF